MSSPDEESVRERFEQERLQRDQSNEQSKRRLRVFGQVVAWLVAILFLAMTLGALYSEYPLLLELIAGYREGWVPTNFLALWLFLLAGMIVGVGALFVLAWKSRRSNDD